ncbi:MAG: hypothetical protein Q4P23_11315, partial [Micrococcaceae bacterium]|nr:hypothetical protein [Micrococcaceae bacterium]
AEVLDTPDGNDVGKSTKTVKVSGYDGVNTVAVDIVDPRDPDAAVDKAEEYINVALQQISAT